jgi:hypothetical protein
MDKRLIVIVVVAAALFFSGGKANVNMVEAVLIMLCLVAAVYHKGLALPDFLVGVVVGVVTVATFIGKGTHWVLNLFGGWAANIHI